MNDDAFIRFMNDYRDYFRALDSYSVLDTPSATHSSAVAESLEDAYYEYYAWKHRALDRSVHELDTHYSKDREPFVDIDQIVLNLES